MLSSVTGWRTLAMGILPVAYCGPGRCTPSTAPVSGAPASGGRPLRDTHAPRRPRGAPSDGAAAEPDLVAVGVTVGGLAHAVGVGLPLGGLESPVGDLGDAGIEVVDEDGVHGMAGMLGPLLDEQVPMFGE